MGSENAEMSAKEQADVYIALAEGARRRFEQHNSVEWRINFGLWTFFVAGAALAATSTWVPSLLACVVCTLLSFCVVYVYWFLWLPHSQAYREECTRIGYWWEAYARTLLPENEGRLPRHLKPRATCCKKWREPSDKGWDPDPVKYDSHRDKRHESHRMWLWVTLVAMSFFLGALWDKWWHGSPAHVHPPCLTQERN
jgi:Ca2+/Na+ antiporter